MAKRPFAAVAAFALCIPTAMATPPPSATSDAPTGTAPVPPPAWVAKSNEYGKTLLKVLADFNPEMASQLGLPGYDTRVIDLGPDVGERSRAALAKARDVLKQDLTTETDPNVRQDLKIMIDAADRFIHSSELQDQYMLPYTDVGQTVFQGLFVLLQDQVVPERRQKALQRLQCYVGIAPGCTPVATEAQALFDAKAGDKQLLGPYKAEVEQSLANTQRYLDGIRALFAKYKIQGAEPALDALKKQLDTHDAWVKSAVVPRARADFRLPPALYADNLKNVGIDIPPDELIREAQRSFMEIQAQMETLAPYVAKAEGIQATGYRGVIKALKKEQLDRDTIMPYYEKVLAQIEQIIREHHIVALPDRPMIIRLASEAESAAQPAPHMVPPPFINNHGEQGQFVLPLGNPASEKGGKSEAYDDFTCKACAWTLTAHEGRPGHELQFSAMLEHGVSLARSLFAFNSVNVEGWALYAEWMMVPWEPPGGQMIALQLRLQRAARAFLDPMLNLGLITRQRAHDIMVNDVVLSEPMTRQELDRYTFRSPGQATAYFYGYSRILELRAHTEIALGDRFNLQQFNDFLLAQGLLPPDQMAEAVDAEFIPSHKKTPE